MWEDSEYSSIQRGEYSIYWSVHSEHETRKEGRLAPAMSIYTDKYADSTTSETNQPEKVIAF